MQDRKKRRGLQSGPRAILRVLLTIATIYVASILTYQLVHDVVLRVAVVSIVTFVLVVAICALTEKIS